MTSNLCLGVFYALSVWNTRLVDPKAIGLPINPMRFLGIEFRETLAPLIFAAYYVQLAAFSQAADAGSITT